MKKQKRWLCGALAMIIAFCALPGTNIQKTEAASKNYVVVLDPGHGGGETGAWGTHTINGKRTTYKEEEINWKISQYTKQALSNYSNIKVYLTRTEKQYMSITGRVSMASLLDADLLVSQHINSVGSSSARGASVMISKGTYRSYLHTKEKLFGSYVMEELGKLGIYKRFPSTGGMEYRMSENGSRYPNGAARDYYGIVARSVESNLPGVIIEHAFVSNKSDVQNFLSSDAKLKKLGQADAKAIVRYFNAQSADGGTVVKPTPTVQAKWIKKNNKWYYRKSDNTYAKGWLTLGSEKYYLNSSGIMQTGWEKINGSWYYFTTSGVMKKGWLTSNGKRYYLTSSGKMAKGLQTINGRVYYLSPSASGKYPEGARVTGWKKLNNKWYYLAVGGAPVGWKKISSKWYYFANNSVMKTGWITDKGKHYYLRKSPSTKSGQMYAGTTVRISGKNYKFNSSGACTNY